MATGYPDFYRLTHIGERAALLYFERVFQEVVGALTIDDERLIPIGGNMYIRDSITMTSSGTLWCLGEVYLLVE